VQDPRISKRKKHEIGTRLKRTRAAVVFFLLFGFLGLVIYRPARAQTNFYRGKTMTYVVNMAAGDSPDLWARAVARNMEKHVPGNPTIITQNMPGGGSMIAANYLYSVAKPDGLNVGAVSANLYFRQLTGMKEVQFDWRKFTWIGSNSRLESLLIMRADAPYKSIEDIRAASEPPKCSTTAIGSTSHITLKVVEEGLGAKFRIVTGYKSGSDQDLAVERGEVQCRAVTTAAFLAREPFQTWQKKGFIRVLVQTARKRNPKLPDVPTVHELMDRFRVADANRRLVLVMLGADNFGNFPTAAPPGVPADRLKILRDAYSKALTESDFLAEAKKRNWEIDPIAAEELTVLAKEVIDQPPPVTERIKQLLTE
jgi:tripartite-type tricarboxylate transporter receptor subunit TctC